jgi:hypothetical protein
MIQGVFCFVIHFPINGPVKFSITLFINIKNQQTIKTRPKRKKMCDQHSFVELEGCVSRGL